MPHPFKAYEVEILQLLLLDEFSREELSQLLEAASTPRVECTNYGFYISVQHPAIGRARRIYNGPTTLTARCGGHTAGFIVFLENDELMLETYPLFADEETRMPRKPSNPNRWSQPPAALLSRSDSMRGFRVLATIVPASGGSALSR